MELLTKEITLGFYNEQGILNIPISQFDTGRVIVIGLEDDSKEYKISDTVEVKLKAQKPDGTQINTDGYCTIENNKIKLQVFEQLSIVYGIVTCELILTDGDIKITTSKFNIIVQKSVHNDDNLKSTDEYIDFIETINKLNFVMENLVLKTDKDVAGGIPSLDENTKVPIDELYEATTDSKGITQLTDSVESESTTTAATPNSVKQTYDKAVEIDANLTAEIVRSTDAEKTLTDNLNAEISRAKEVEETKAPIDSPTFTGIPNAPNATVETDTTQIATTHFVHNNMDNHNSSATAHADIRELLSDVIERLETFLDSDDVTLDQLTEIITYIKDNRELIDSITTSKVSVVDIVDSLVSTSTEKPLSANQGKILNDLITELTNIVDGKANETDLHTHANKSVIDTITQTLIDKWNSSVTHITDTVKHITSSERTNWNAAKTHADSTHAPSGAEVNQNAFSNIKVGTTTIVADSKTDTLELVAGSNVTITPDVTSDKITISSVDTKYTHPTTAGNKHIPSGGSTGQILKWDSNGTAVWANESGGNGSGTIYQSTEPTTGLVKGNVWIE